jgi:hypothetical protein
LAFGTAFEYEITFEKSKIYWYNLNKKMNDKGEVLYEQVGEKLDTLRCG